MGMIRDAKVQALVREADKAADAGRALFTPKLNTPGTHHGMSGDIATWALMIEAVEDAGWHLIHWTVAADAKGRPEAYPVFRRMAVGMSPRGQ